MTEIVTQAEDLNSAVRGHAFPALESGNTSFPRGRYVVRFEPGEDGSSFTVGHRIEGAPLIERVIADGLAQFVCTVASPRASYRVSHASRDSTQVIAWRSDELGEPPMFTPMVVATERFERTLDRGRDGVHDLWHGRTVVFEPGMRIALSDVVLMHASMASLLLFALDQQLDEGRFRVEAAAEEGFRFRVHLAPGLHRFLRGDSRNPQYPHIVTHIVGACFGLLKSDPLDDDEGGWESYQGLKALAEQLKANGLPLWSEDDFSPELAATTLYPHRVIPAELADEDD